jgi:hypothetical protein
MSAPTDITKAAEELASAILKSAGSDLKHYTTQKSRDEIIGAAVKGLEAWQQFKESVNRATDTEIAKAEREKCAKIADSKSRDVRLGNDQRMMAGIIAAAIRRGGE